jgi:hypothetical protein
MLSFTRILRIVILVELILFIGFLPTLFNENAHLYGGNGGGWDWSPWTFFGPMAGLLFVIGISVDAALRHIKHPAIRIIVTINLLLLLGSIWVMIVRSE